MKSIDFLGKIINAKIDKPIGSIHSNYIYPINCGYTSYTLNNKVKKIECYILGIYEPIEEFSGKCIAIIHRINNQEDKLVIAPENENFSTPEIRVLTAFQERFFENKIIRSNNELIYNKNIPELSVTNLNKSLEFYKTIGFKIEYERPENKFAFISIDEIQFMLQEISNDDKWNISPLTYPFGNGINFQLEVSNIEKIYYNLKRHNYKITFEIEENWYRKGNKLLGNKEFLIQDPDGYLLRFSEDLGKKEVNI